MGKSEPTMLRKRSSTDAGSAAYESAFDHQQADNIQDLFHKLSHLRDTKEKLFHEAQDAIKHAATDAIDRVRSAEARLLNELSASCRRDLANLRKSETALKKKLDDMTSLRQRVALNRGHRVSLGSRAYVEGFSQQVDTEIGELIEEGTKILDDYNQTLEFSPHDKVTFEIGTLHAKGLSDSNLADQRKIVAETDVKVRTNTFSLLSSPRVSHLHSNLRKARSTNDIFRAPRMSLVFTMSNEDLSVERTETSHSCGDLARLPQGLIFSAIKPGKSPGHVNDPRDVTFLPNGDICLAEHGNKRLQLFDQKGNLKQVMQQTVLTPNGITMTRDGYIAVTDNLDKNIKVLTRCGDLVCKFGTGYFKNLTSIKTNSKDHFVVIDNSGQWHQYVFVYNSMTGAKQRIGYSDNGDYVINHPAYVTVDIHDNVIIADSGLHCVWIFDCAGQLQQKFGQQGEGEGQLSYPTGVCSDPSGNIYVADSANHRVCLFSSDGKFVRTVLNGSHGLDYPQVVNVQGSCLAVVQRSGLLYFRTQQL